jgi:mRNA interferase HigB
MHVISKKALKTFSLKHPGAKTPLEAWYKLVSQSEFETFAAIKQAFNSADYVSPYYVFDIAGNHFRIISIIHFNRQKLYVRHVLTHAEYDRWNKDYRSKKS